MKSPSTPAGRRKDPASPAVVSGAAATVLDKDRKAASRPVADKGSNHVLLEKTIDRLEDLIDEETAALRSNRSPDLREFNNRKSQALLELSRVTRVVGNLTIDGELADRLAVLQQKLETNRGLIKMHLDAVREIAALVSGSIQEAESDGTYTPAVRKAGKAG